MTALLLLRILDVGVAGYNTQLGAAMLSLIVGSIVALIACVVPWTERATLLMSTRLSHFGGCTPRPRPLPPCHESLSHFGGHTSHPPLPPCRDLPLYALAVPPHSVFSVVIVLRCCASSECCSRAR